MFRHLCVCLWDTTVRLTKRMELPLGICTRRDTHARTHGPLSRTTRVSRCQKCKTNLDFTEATDSEWQWHQLGQMQVCISLQTDNHASTPPLPPNQQHQSTEGSWTQRDYTKNVLSVAVGMSDYLTNCYYYCWINITQVDGYCCRYQRDMGRLWLVTSGIST